MPETKFPKIRFVEAFPVETNQGKMIGLRDPSGIATDPLLLAPDLFYLLQYFDGQHSVVDLRYEYLHAFGDFVYEDLLSQFILHLDTHLYLDNAKFQAKLQQLEQEILEQPVRPAAHAGTSYAADPTKLKEQIAGFFRRAGGVGLPELNHHQKEIRGLIAPHIDLRAGGACYAHAYKELAESTGAECFVILGTGHSGLTNLYSVLPKDFETPFGKAECDLGFINELNRNYDGVFESEVLPHKSEHTIEFQLLFLQYLLQGRKRFTFVPILCSFSYHQLDGEQFPREAEIAKKFSSALKKTVANFHKKVCLIASVDMSHVGPRYGDERAPDQAFLSKVKQADQTLLHHVEAVDGPAFYDCIKEYEDRYRVCGFSPIYTLLQAIEAKQGKLLNYASAAVDSHHSTVTFASLVLG
ncbi:MAG: AmmeMemoRadiSam system protein B [bacterium]